MAWHNMACLNNNRVHFPPVLFTEYQLVTVKIIPAEVFTHMHTLYTWIQHKKTSQCIWSMRNSAGREGVVLDSVNEQTALLSLRLKAWKQQTAPARSLHSTEACFLHTKFQVSLELDLDNLLLQRVWCHVNPETLKASSSLPVFWIKNIEEFFFFFLKFCHFSAQLFWPEGTFLWSSLNRYWDFPAGL